MSLWSELSWPSLAEHAVWHALPSKLLLPLKEGKQPAAMLAMGVLTPSAVLLCVRSEVWQCMAATLARMGVQLKRV